MGFEEIYNILEDDGQEDPVLDKLYDDLYNTYNKITLHLIRKKYHVEAELVDDEHISIDGEVMDADEFAEWIMFKEGIPIPERTYDA